MSDHPTGSELSEERQSYPATRIGIGRVGRLLVLVAALATLGIIIVHASTPGARNALEQPIDFFHRLHSGERGIDCAFCHRTATTAAFAGMPSTQLCMRCHRVVVPYVPEIWKLRSYWEMEESIPWKRVYNLPGFIHFSHQAHLAGGRMDCEPCHGKVETMDRLRQEVPLTMGWCLDCHRKMEASTDCASCHR